MKMKFIKYIGLLLGFWLVTCFSFSAFADETRAYDWYFKKNDCHEQPALDSNLKFIKDYDCYYLNSETKDKVIYLTFDAGYENGNVEKVLEVLEKHHATGAFFILENLIRRCPELVLRMKNGGQLVCNHTAKHPDMSAIHDKSLFAKQLSDLEKQYTDLTGEEMEKFYRPPQGRFTRENLKYAKELGYKTVFWSFAYADWDNNRQPDPQKAVQNILDHTHPGMILLLHPTSATNAQIMDELLTAWEREGYRFGSLQELGK